MQDQDIISEEERNEAATEAPVGESKSEVEVEQRKAPLAHFPSGADGTEPGEDEKAKKQAAFNRRTWTFCDGLFPIVHVDTQEGFMALCKINGRTFRESVVKEDLGELGEVWNGYIYDKDQVVTSVNGLGKGKNATKLMTHAAFRAYVKQLSGGGKKYHSRKGFLRQNAARARAAAKQGGEGVPPSQQEVK